MQNIHAALEIGTTRTVLAVGETGDGGRLKVTRHAEIPSAGVRKSQILDIAQATQSIRSVLQRVERRQGEQDPKINIGNALLVVSGQHVQSNPFFGAAQVANSRVGQDAINEASNSAHSITLPKGRELLDVVEQDYVLDSLAGIRNPAGMSGGILKLNTLQIHGDRNRIQDAVTAATGAHLEIREYVYAATCAAEAVLEEHEKNNGVLVIDFGGGSTSYAAYLDGYLAATGVIGVGGDHVTNDIAQAFQTTTAQAEGMKCGDASCTIAAREGESPRVRVERGDNTLMDNRTVSRQALNTVVNARMMELLTIIREALEDQDLMHRIHSGAVLTGGGAQLRGLDALAEKVLGLNVRTGRPIHVDGLEKEEFPAAYASIAGALLYANRNCRDESILGGILGRFFR